MVAVLVLAVLADYPRKHPGIFYSMLAAHIYLSIVRVWLLFGFDQRPKSWRRLLCGS